jgi:hypothetical protein
MTHDAMFYRWVNGLVLGTRGVIPREVEPALGLAGSGIAKHGYRRYKQRDRGAPALLRSYRFLFFDRAARWRRAMNSVSRRLLFFQLCDLQLVAHLRPRAVDSMGR